MTTPPSLAGGSLAERLVSGDQRALARLATLVENETPAGLRALADLYPRTGQAHRIGLTGPPGAGKSSLIARLVTAYRAAGRRVGVIAVDPSSALSGGAVLGDRVRMAALDAAADPDLFIRSMASRGQAGGLAPATAGVAHLLDAAGYDPILIETLGVGQDETAVAGLVQTVVVLQVPGLGDGVQAIKAGLLEIADVFAVHKADLPGADDLTRELAALLRLAPAPTDDWTPPIVRVSSSVGTGIEELLAAIASHRAWLAKSGGLADRARQMATAEILLHLQRRLLGAARRPGEATALCEAVSAVAERRLAPHLAAEELLTVGAPSARQSF